MYPIEAHRLGAVGVGRWRGIGANVYFLGLTSLLTDLSSEMVTSILPLYAVVALGLTPLQYGIIDGLYQGAAAVARLAGGVLADRWRRNREVAAVGYGLSAVCKPALLAVGGVWGALATVIALDRIGKGIRTPSRDALISLSSAPPRLGLAFGVHRAFDTAGALLGPVAAFSILAVLPNGYDVVFVTSFCVALAGLAALLLFVRNPRVPTGVQPDGQPSLQAAIGLLRSPRFRTVVLGAAALGLLTVGDGFLYLRIQRIASLSPSLFPLLYVGTAATYLLLAIPAGRLSDRIGRGRVFLLGQGLLVAACVAPLALPPGDVGWTAWLTLGLLGAYYACTDGVLMAAASVYLPAQLRASGFAIVTTATGLARLVSSLLFGALWTAWGIEAALLTFAVGLAATALTTMPIWLRLRNPS
jgi:MFS family permease